MRYLVPTLSILALLWAVSLMASPASSQFETSTRTFKDDKGDVLTDAGLEPLETLSDLKALPDRKAPESKERLSVDIVSLRILENETYVSYVMEMEGPVYYREEYTYAIAGYARSEERETDPFDFMLVATNGTARYLLWDQGDFRVAGNVTRIDIDGNILNITMHRSRFILRQRSDPHLIVAIAQMLPVGGSERLVDHMIAEKGKDDGGFSLGSSEILALQIMFIVIMFVVLFIIYGIWSRRKGEVVTGGVCPRCESRLDPSINFCPSCGTVIRGPEAEKAMSQEKKEKAAVEE